MGKYTHGRPRRFDNKSRLTLVIDKVCQIFPKPSIKHIKHKGLENIDSGHSNFKLDDRSGRRYHNVDHLHIHARSPNPTLRAGPVQNVPLLPLSSKNHVSLLDHSVSDGEQSDDTSLPQTRPSGPGSRDQSRPSSSQARRTTRASRIWCEPPRGTSAFRPSRCTVTMT